MAELIVVGFDGIRRAAELLDRLEMLNCIWAIELKDAVAVYRTDDGRLRIDRSVYPTTKEEIIWGGVLGALVGGVLLSPLAAMIAVLSAAAAIGLGGAAIGATGGAVVGHEEASTRGSHGISDEFLKQVGGMVQPGHSALFTLLQAGDPDVIGEQFRGVGGTILRTTLKPDETKKLQETLAG